MDLRRTTFFFPGYSDARSNVTGDYLSKDEAEGFHGLERTRLQTV